jgi:hypothetical protein
MNLLGNAAPLPLAVATVVSLAIDPRVQQLGLMSDGLNLQCKWLSRLRSAQMLTLSLVA